MITSGVGAMLREERLRQGQSLEQIAHQTKISQRFLQAIEADDFAVLRTAVFTRNFVRQFASALGMDPVPLLAGLPKIDIESLVLPDTSQFSRPRGHRLPGFSDRRWATALSSFLWIALAAGVSTGAYLYFNSRPNSNFNPKHAPPARKVEIAAVAPAPAATPVAVPAAVPAMAEPVLQDTAAIPSKSPVQVVLRAREASWVQIIADGKNAFTGMLNPNDSRTVDAVALVKVTAGNAGGLELSLNGKPLGPLGPSGEVRTMRLTADGPQLVLKTAPAAAAPL